MHCLPIHGRSWPQLLGTLPRSEHPLGEVHALVELRQLCANALELFIDDRVMIGALRRGAVTDPVRDGAAQGGEGEADEGCSPEEKHDRQYTFHATNLLEALMRNAFRSPVRPGVSECLRKRRAEKVRAVRGLFRAARNARSSMA